MTANWIDIFCGSFLLILVGLGLYFGLAKTLIHLAAWIGGAIGVIYFPEILQPLLSENLERSATPSIIFSRGWGFFIPFISLRILGHFINKFIKRHFSLLNSLGGGILGAIKALIPCVILLSTLYLLPLSGNLKSERDSSLAYSLYSYSIQKTGISEKAQNFQDSVKASVSHKIHATIDSVKESAVKNAEAQIQEKIQKSVRP